MHCTHTLHALTPTPTLHLLHPADFTGTSPNSRYLSESLARLATSLPEGHPMVLKCEALAGVVEEMAATRTELSTASTRMNTLRSRLPRRGRPGSSASASAIASASGTQRGGSSVPAHTLWSSLTDMSAATPRSQRPVERAGRSRSPSPLPDSPVAAPAAAGHSSHSSSSSSSSSSHHHSSALFSTLQAALGDKGMLPATASSAALSPPKGGQFGTEPTGRAAVRKASPRPFSPPVPRVDVGSARRGSGREGGRALSPASRRQVSPTSARAESQWAAFVRSFQRGGEGGAGEGGN